MPVTRTASSWYRVEFTEAEMIEFMASKIAEADPAVDPATVTVNEIGFITSGNTVQVNPFTKFVAVASAPASVETLPVNA